MKLTSRIGVAAGLAALAAMSLGSAHAADAPSDLEYSYTVNQPVIGPMNVLQGGDCVQAKGAPFTLAMTGGVEQALTAALATPGNDVTCTLNVDATLTALTITGTVAASYQGQGGSGTFTLICDVGRTVTSWFHALVTEAGDPYFAPDPYDVNSDGYVSCNWTIDVSDAQKSQLSGTIEMQGSFSKDSTEVDWSNCGALYPVPPHALPRARCVEFDMDITAYLTGATGAYAGRTGEGSMTQTVYAPMLVPIDLDATPPDPPTCPDTAPDCVSLDLTGCDFSPTNPGDPSWMDLSGLPVGAQIPGFQGPGWYRCGGDDGGGGGGSLDLTNCEYSLTAPADPNEPGWYDLSTAAPGTPIPGFKGPGWYKCGGGDDGGGGGGGSLDLTNCEYSLTAPADPNEPGWYDLSTVAPGTPIPGFKGPGWYKCPVTAPTSGVVLDQQYIRAAFLTLVSPRSSNDFLSLSTKPGGSVAPRFVAPAQTLTGVVVRDFPSTSSTTVRISTVPGATCTVTAKAGKAATTLVKAGKALKGIVDTKKTSAMVKSALKAATGATATLTAACTTKAGKKITKLPVGTVTVKFT